MIEINLLTKSGNKVLNKKLCNERLSQIESNYLSKTIRPKLKKIQKIKKIDIDSILQRIQYNQKGLAIEEKLKVLIRKILGKKLDSIIVYGSAIQTNYYSYNDIDILVLTKRKLWKTQNERFLLKKKIKVQTKLLNLNVDPQIIDKPQFYLEYLNSPSLIYQLKDSKAIYGKLNIPSKIQLYKIDLHMKLDWSKIYDPKPKGSEIYHALRNTILVRLILNRIVDNSKLREYLYDELGKNIIEKLKNNQETKLDRKMALAYLKELIIKTRAEIGSDLWGKIDL